VLNANLMVCRAAVPIPAGQIARKHLVSSMQFSQLHYLPIAPLFFAVLIGRMA
jgi:hypothetical protein